MTSPSLVRCYNKSYECNVVELLCNPLLQREGKCNYHETFQYCTEREKLQLLQPLQYCRKISSNYCEPSRIAEREKLQLLEPLLYCGDRNCNYCDPSSMAERDKLQLLRPLQYCREIRVRAPHDRVASQWYDPMDRRRTGKRTFEH